MKEWLTVKEAALLVGRHPRKIYEWIEGPLTARTAANGTYEVRRTDLLRVETTMKRGRPRGTAKTR